MFSGGLKSQSRSNDSSGYGAEDVGINQDLVQPGLTGQEVPYSYLGSCRCGVGLRIFTPLDPCNRCQTTTTIL